MCLWVALMEHGLLSRRRRDGRDDGRGKIELRVFKSPKHALAGEMKRDLGPWQG